MHLISSSESERGHKEIKGAIQCTDCWKEKNTNKNPLTAGCQHLKAKDLQI